MSTTDPVILRPSSRQRCTSAASRNGRLRPISISSVPPATIANKAAAATSSSAFARRYSRTAFGRVRNRDPRLVSSSGLTGRTGARGVAEADHQPATAKQDRAMPPSSRPRRRRTRHRHRARRSPRAPAGGKRRSNGQCERRPRRPSRCAIAALSADPACAITRTPIVREPLHRPAARRRPRRRGRARSGPASIRRAAETAGSARSVP